MNKIIVEVGSTCTKVDKFDGNNIEKLDLFKKLFAINSNDINITSYVILLRENVIAEHLETLKVLFANKAFIRQDKIFVIRRIDLFAYLKKEA